MRLLLFTALALSLFTTAFAQEGNGVPAPPTSGDTVSKSNAASDSDSNSDSNSQSASNNAINATTQVTALAYGDLPGLYRLPQAVCQGTSTAFGAQFNNALTGAGLTAGGSKIDPQCTLRANILLLIGISGDPNLMFMMISQLEGLERLWDIDQDEDCREWLIENDDEADEHGCVWPEFEIVDKSPLNP